MIPNDHPMFYPDCPHDGAMLYMAPLMCEMCRRSVVRDETTGKYRLIDPNEPTIRIIKRTRDV